MGRGLGRCLFCWVKIRAQIVARDARELFDVENAFSWHAAR